MDNFVRALTALSPRSQALPSILHGEVWPTLAPEVSVTYGIRYSPGAPSSYWKGRVAKEVGSVLQKLRDCEGFQVSGETIAGFLAKTVYVGYMLC